MRTPVTGVLYAISQRRLNVSVSDVTAGSPAPCVTVIPVNGCCTYEVLTPFVIVVSLIAPLSTEICTLSKYPALSATRLPPACTGTSPADARSLSRNNIAGYVDLFTKLTKNWQIGAAARAEHYDDSAGNTLSGKVSTRYELLPGLALTVTVTAFLTIELPTRAVGRVAAEQI